MKRPVRLIESPRFAQAVAELIQITDEFDNPRWLLIACDRASEAEVRAVFGREGFAAVRTIGRLVSGAPGVEVT